MVFSFVGNAFKGLGKQIAKPFSGVINAFKLLGCMLKNLGKVLLATIKYVLFELFHLAFVRADKGRFLTIVQIVWKYIAFAVWILAQYSGLVVVYVVADLVLMFASKGAKVSARRVVGGMLQCNADPREWYTRAGHERGNATGKVGGAFCGTPCVDGYRPALGGFSCRRLPGGVPYYCPRAAVTKLYEGGRTRGPQKVHATGSRSEDVAAFRAACGAQRRTPGQELLVDAVCWRAPRGGALAGFCYEHGCRAHGRKDFDCGGGLADSEKTAETRTPFQLLVLQAVLMLAVAPVLMWMTSDADSRAARYARAVG